MHISKQLARHFREVYFGGNWTFSNLKDQLADVTWQQANGKVNNLNSIAALTYHIHYYVRAVMSVLNGGELTAKDEYSYQHPPIATPEDWELFKQDIFAEAETFASLVEQLPDEVLDDIFSDEKYGSYYRNLQGIIEHSHYHLGQIAVIRKLTGQ